MFHHVPTCSASVRLLSSDHLCHLGSNKLGANPPWISFFPSNYGNSLQFEIARRTQTEQQQRGPRLLSSGIAWNESCHSGISIAKGRLYMRSAGHGWNKGGMKQWGKQRSAAQTGSFSAPVGAPADSYGRNRWLVNRVLSAASHSRVTINLTSTFSLQQSRQVLLQQCHCLIYQMSCS